MFALLLYIELRLWMRRQWLGHERRHEKANHRWHLLWHWSNQQRVADLGIVAWPDRIRHAYTRSALAGGGA